jgi:hypothetical protein
MSRELSKVDTLICTPLEVALAATTTTYLLSAFASRGFGHDKIAATLLRGSTITIAALLTLFVYALLGFHLGLIPSARAVRSGNMKVDRARVAAARDTARKSVAAASRWWDYALAAVGGIAYGALLDRCLAWLMA